MKTEKYSSAFRPYVFPESLPRDRSSLPDGRWLALMAHQKLRSILGAGAIHANQFFGLKMLSERARSLAPDAPGRMATDGDLEFAYQRFAGPNPFALRLARDMSDVPEKLRLSDATFEQLMGAGSNLMKRIALGQIFIFETNALRVFESTDLQPGKFVCHASALFCHVPHRRLPFNVVPLAIECARGRADGETGVFTPLEPRLWRAAKHALNVADINAAELCVHLARAHYMTAPFAMAIRSALPKSHPLYQFLFPHLRFNPFVDFMAWFFGVRSSSGILVESLAGSARWSQDVARTVHRDHSFREQHFERDLAERRLDTHSVPYPYRDDGRLLWDAIKRFAAGYVELTYTSDAALENDAHVTALVDELVDPQRGNVRGLLEGERLRTRDELVEILTQVLFVAGPLHALSHFASAAQLQDADANPAFLRSNPIQTGDRARPGASRAMSQYMRVISTNIHHDQFGDFTRYAIGSRGDTRHLLERFRADLCDIEAMISGRNSARLAPFIHLLPSRISNGIAV